MNEPSTQVTVWIELTGAQTAFAWVLAAVIALPLLSIAMAAIDLMAEDVRGPDDPPRPPNAAMEPKEFPRFALRRIAIAAFGVALMAYTFDPVVWRDVVPGVSAAGMVWPNGALGAARRAAPSGDDESLRALADERGWTVRVERVSTRSFP